MLTPLLLVCASATMLHQLTYSSSPDDLHWKYYIVYCCWLGFEAVFLFFCTFPFTCSAPSIRPLFTVVVETKHRTLEETAALFDGEDALNKISLTATRQAGVTNNVSLNADEKGSQYRMQ